MKLTVGMPTPRVSRKVMKGIATKRTAHGQQRLIAARTEERTTVDPCDNSNDSGLGFDQHLEFQLAARSTVRFADQEAAWSNEHCEAKRKKLEIKLESDDANDNFGFPETMSRREKREESHRITRTGAHLEHTESGGIAMVRSQQHRPQALASRRTAVVPVSSAGAVTSRNGKTQLQIVCQPEAQHRARYQTEGSRGAVKDRSGNGFPVVKLTNYNKPATLEVFIGTDMGRVQPHMFYQACRVSGKNSTPCVEKKIDGTVVIDVEFDQAKDYVVTCDCVGILKERNVDVEHRFPNEQQTRNKKKSTRCRMVFRTKIVHPDGSEEWLQLTSQPIVCTQPPGVPEICKKSLSACPCTGGLELFILGKNFLKDTSVLFQQTDAETTWEESVQPDKEFLQQTHLVCVVPPYRRTDITETVTVKLAITSSGKTSEPHNFTYTPTIQQPAVVPENTQPCITLVQSAVSHTGGDIPHSFPRSPLVPPGASLVLADAGSTRTTKTSPKKNQYISIDSVSSGSNNTIGDSDSPRLMMWHTPLLPSAETSKIENKITAEKEMDRMSGKIMPPPPLLPIATRRRGSSNIHLLVPDSDPLKTELKEDGKSRSPEDVKVVDLCLKPVATVSPLGSASDLSNTQAPTLATFQRFVTGTSGTPLPTQSGPSVEKYLSNLENVSEPGGVRKPTAQCIVPPCKMADTVTEPLLSQQQTPQNVSVPLIYRTQNASECKPRFSSEDAPLLRHKSSYEEVLNIGANSDTVIGRRHMVILPESQSRNPLVSSINETVSAMMDPVTNSSTLTMYASGERTVAREEKTSHLSALVSHIQPSESDKLDALVNSAAVSHMIPTPSSTDQTSPIPVKKMSLDPPSYNLMSTCNEMLCSPNSQLNVDAGGASSNTSNVMFASHDRTSPIAIKSIINSSAEGQIILSSTQNSPGAGNMLDPRGQVLSSGSTSPIAVKKMMETQCENQMLSTNPTNTNTGQMLSRTSPIAMKTMMEQSGTPINSDSCLTNTPSIAIKTIMNSEVSETMMPVTTMAAATQGSSSERIELNSLIQQENILTSRTQVTSTENPSLNVLVQSTLSSHPQQNPVLSSGTQAAPTPSTDALVQSTLNNQPQVILTSSAHMSVESARLNAITQSAINNQNQTSILVSGPQLSEDNASLNSLTQSILNNQTQQQSVLVSNVQLSEDNSRLDSFTQPLMNSLNQQSAIMASNTQVSENSSRLATLTQSLMNSPTQQTAAQVSEDTRLSQLTSILNSQAQQQTVQASEDNSRLNSLTQSILNSHSQQQTVLTTGIQASEDNTRIGSLTQTMQQAVMPPSVQITENSTALNSLTQSMINSQSSDTVLVSSAALCEHSAKLRSYAQSLMNSQSQQQALIASAAETTTLNALVQPSLGSHRHQETAAQACIPTIVTQASQPLRMPPVTAGEALLNTMFATNQNPTVQTPTTVIVGSGNLLEGTQFATATSESQGLMTGCTVTNKQPQSQESSSGFMAQMLLGLGEEKLKKGTEMSLEPGNKNVVSSSVQQKQEKTLQPEGATVVQQPQQPTPQKKSEEGMVPQELAQMSENDLLSYINPSTFDQGF